MKDKANVRYLGFRSAPNGGRLFDFCISRPPLAEVLTSFEICSDLFSGDAGIRLQEGVGICYAKLKHLVETSDIEAIPGALSLTSSDLAQYREAMPAGKRHTYSKAAKATTDQEQV